VLLPPGVPAWKEHEGLLLIRLRFQDAACAVQADTLRLKVWWHHAFLRQALDSDLVLEVSKAWIDGLQRDMVRNRLTPANFTVTAIFEDLEATPVAPVVGESERAEEASVASVSCTAMPHIPPSTATNRSKDSDDFVANRLCL